MSNPLLLVTQGKEDFFVKKQNVKIFGSVRKLTFAAMLAAISVVVGIFCKTYLNFGNGLMRLSFESLPVIVSGIAFGPVIGGFVGFVADIISYSLSIQAFAISPVISLAATLLGVIPGIITKYIFKKRSRSAIIASGVFAHLISSVIIKTAGLFVYYGWAVLIRIPIYFAIAALEIFIICQMFKNIAFARMINELDTGKMAKKHFEATMTASEAIEYIHSVSWTFCKPGLDRIRVLCDGLGNPQEHLKFIHVAGTNGKGSFSSMMDSVLRSAGYKVGLFTSPYILEFNERIKLNGKNIPDGDLARIVSKVKIIADKMEEKPTEFELITAIGLEYFRESGCDYVILECGMGGRLDSTNIIKTSILSVITGIALDHTAFLGDTVEKIAYEKAGIIKENVPVLFCGEDHSAADIIERVANERGAEFLTPMGEPNIKEMTLDGTTFDYLGYEDVKIKLLGAYQVKNARNVLSALEILKRQGIKLENKDIVNGLFEARWPARFEIIKNKPLMIFDGGHNPQGVEAAVDSVKKYFGDKKLNIITGVMADKDYNYIASKISEVAARVYCLTPDNPRALDAGEYAKVFESVGVEAHSFDTVESAVKCAMADSKDEGRGILCLGSLYMYCEVVKYL